MVLMIETSDGRSKLTMLRLMRHGTLDPPEKREGEGESDEVRC